MKNLSAMLLCDFYKLSHREQYPDNTEVVYSTWTPRASRIEGIDKVVSFGQQAFIKDFLIEFFNENFFGRPKQDVVNEYKRIIKSTLGVAEPSSTHIEELYDLGYLPLLIKSVAEGTLVPLRVPMMTIQNTDNRFFWLTNYIESLASCELWQASTSATLAYQYRKLLDKYAEQTSSLVGFTQFQGHDFSMRGMSSLKSAISSGMGHLLSFVGTDTIPAIQAAELFYGANVEKELVGTSIPATEHSVQCAYGNDEVYIERMITKIVPSGYVSVVADGYDFWNVVGIILPRLKNKILAREGKVVIRPDSGDPVKILCGNKNAPTGSLEYKGLVECLYEIFGGSLNDKCYKELNPKIGCIYGDAITLERAEQICKQLAAKGFASTNVVYGIGSYTYQLNTRDTFGFALKSTLCVINGDEKQIFKNPKTDNGIKKSQKGAVIVYRDELGKLQFSDEHTLSEVDNVDGINLLKPIFENGKLLKEVTLSEIRTRLAGNVEEIQGDLLETDCKVIAHGVNCQGVMGSGVAKALYEKWPRVKAFYHDYFTEFNAGIDGENFLGEVDDIVVDRNNGKVVVNCFTQQYFGGDGRLYLSYEALRTCMKQVRAICEYNDVNELAIPKIGCGLAGGDWNKVKTILNDVFPENFKVKVYIK